MEPDTARSATRIGVVALLMGLAGLGVSIYLTVAHYQSATVLACPDTGIVNCTKVTTSSYSSQFGIPLAVLGLVFFAVALLFQNPWAWRSASPLVRRARLVVATGGAVMVLWLIWVELFRLDAICLYCTAVHALSILLFILTGVGTAATVPGVDSDEDGETDGHSSRTRAVAVR